MRFTGILAICFVAMACVLSAQDMDKDQAASKPAEK